MNLNTITLAEHTFLDKLNKDSFVLDLGACKGEFTEKIINKYGCKIYTVEADEELCRQLIEKYNLYKGIPKFLLLNALISGENGINFFYPRQKDKMSGSLFESHPSVTLNYIPKTTTTLDDLTLFYDFRHIDLLKMDVEGAEFGILQNTVNAINTLHICKQITVEFHDYLAMAKFTEEEVLKCIDKLKKLGFEFLNCSKPHQPKYFDCLFYRK